MTGQFYMVDHDLAIAKKFCDTNAVARSWLPRLAAQNHRF